MTKSVRVERTSRRPIPKNRAKIITGRIWFSDAAVKTFKELLEKAPADSGFRLRAQQMLAVLGVSVPHYWLGMVMVIVFSVQLGWLPPGGGLVLRRWA